MPMSFKDRPFSERFGVLGDEAERVFEESYPQGFVRTGLNRPPISLKHVPGVVRHTPDYLTSKGYVEVQGFGADQYAKFKPVKLAALATWHRMFRVDFFLWDSHYKRYGWVRLPDLMIGLRTHNLQEYHDGGEYFAVPAGELPMAAEWASRWDPLSADR